MGVSVESILTAIEENPDAKSVFLINPTYYGVASDLKSIIRIAHNHGMSVIVDEAHGAHMSFHDEFPLTAMKAGADMSAVSLHKTAGSLTQSSALLWRDGNIDHEKVKKVLNVITTTSPSYLLMSSIDIARKQLAIIGYDKLKETSDIVRAARDEINKIGGMYAFGKELIGTPECFDFDETKLAINVRNLGYTGYEVEKMLRKDYNIQVELSDLYNILTIITLGDRKEDLMILCNALKDIALRAKMRELRTLL